jgi:hypothetical protein
MAVNDLAGGATYGPLTPEILLAGDEPIKTSNGTAGAALSKYQVCAVTSTGSVVVFVSGTHTAHQAVLAMQPAASGAQVQYAYQGVFNDDLLAAQAGNATLYAAAAMDTFVERKAFFNSLFRVGKVGGGWAAV